MDRKPVTPQPYAIPRVGNLENGAEGGHPCVNDFRKPSEVLGAGSCISFLGPGAAGDTRVSGSWTLCAA